MKPIFGSWVFTRRCNGSVERCSRVSRNARRIVSLCAVCFRAHAFQVTQQNALRLADHLTRDVGLIVDPFLQQEWRSTVLGFAKSKASAGGRDPPGPRAGFIRIIPPPPVSEKAVISRDRLS